MDDCDWRQSSPYRSTSSTDVREEENSIKKEEERLQELKKRKEVCEMQIKEKSVRRKKARIDQCNIKIPGAVRLRDEEDTLGQNKIKKRRLSLEVNEEENRESNLVGRDFSSISRSHSYSPQEITDYTDRDAGEDLLEV